MTDDSKLPLHTSSDPSSSITHDVVVIGAGMAGKAASLQLARSGLNVVCISPLQGNRQPVGESLDWAAPGLLKELGLSMESLIEGRMATWKRHVILKMPDGQSADYAPSEWLGQTPFNIELRTLHVDRTRLDQELLMLAGKAGVSLVSDKIVAIEHQRGEISSVRGADGRKYSAKWFIDASGGASSLFARELNLSKTEYGPPKVAMWAYFPVADPVEGTTLYVDPRPAQYLHWIWEIPVNPQTVSVGVVTTGEWIKAQRDQGLPLNEICKQALTKFSRFEPLVGTGAIGEMNVTSFRCRAYREVAGPNWLICGEAASMVDPITSNGVTAALRHAAEASFLIRNYFIKGRLPWRARICYSSRIARMARFFNGGIERIVYEPRIRDRIGLPKAGTVYTTPAWTMNAVYARLRPSGMISTLLLNILLGISRFSALICYRLSSRTTGDAASSPDQSQIAAS